MAKRCTKKHSAKGYCQAHYQRVKRKMSMDTELREAHGMFNTKEYKAWAHMKERCNNKNCKVYKSYGGRGIKVCIEWSQSFKEFFKDMGYCPQGFSLDRIDNNGNYEPSNCKWSSATEQLANRRPFGKSGVRGVHLNGGKFYARIMYGGTTYQLGSSKKLSEAKALREQAEIRVYGRVIQ